MTTAVIKEETPKEPILELAMTNSVLDIGTGGIYLGYNTRQSNTDGYAKAWFDNCVITSGQFSVYYDRPLNGAYFNNTRIVETIDNEWWLEVQGNSTTNYEGITIGDGGVVLDNQSFDGMIKADLQGTGPITKVGSGTAEFNIAQTGTGTFTVQEGALSINGVSVASHPLVVSDGATLYVKSTSTDQAVAGSLTLASGSTLDMKHYDARTPIQLTSLSLPDEGTAALKYNGGEVPKGVHAILAKEGIAVDDVQNKLVPMLEEGDSATWSVTDNVLYLKVPIHGKWTGEAGAVDGVYNFSTAANWDDGEVPSAGDTIDFSAITDATTINCGDIGATVFADVTNGTGVITFTGSITATNFTNTSKIIVGENATVTMNGDLVITGSDDTCIVYSVLEGGRFVVTGNVEAAATFTGGNLYPVSTSGKCSGKIVVGGTIANEGGTDGWTYRMTASSIGANWVIGAGGMSGTSKYYATKGTAHSVIQPLDSDFTISAWIGNRAILTLNTTGDDGNPHAITIGDGGAITRDGTVNITGTGKVVADCDASTDSYYSLTYCVTNSATLALCTNTYVTTGTITVHDGVTLAVAESGTAALQGALTLADGAKLAFNFTEASSAPVLDKNDKTLTVSGSSVTVTVTGDVRPKMGKYKLTTGGGFSDKALALGEGSADWRMSLSVDADGNIELYVIPRGPIIVIR